MISLRQTKINEVMQLLGSKRQYGTGYMHSAFKALGATMRERTGRVDTWVASKGDAGLDYLIETLGGDPAALKTQWEAQRQAEMTRGMKE